MSIMQSVNISMGAICCAVCVILLVCAVTSEFHDKKLNKNFISVLSVAIALILVDISIFYLEGRAGESVNIIFRTSYFLSFLLGSVLLILFTFYFLALIGIKTTVVKKAVYASFTAIGICAVNILLIILTQFFGLYYRIGEGNIFQYGDYYIVSQILAIICMLLNTGVIFLHRKAFEKRERIFLLSYIALPLLSIFVQNMIEETIASIDVATTLTSLIFYAGVQSELSKKLKEKELELAQSRIDIMLSQIRPHFLFNSLSSIAALCDISPRQVKEAVESFAHYLRGNLESIGQRGLIDFEDELLHVETYLSLEKLRHGDKLNIKYDIALEEFKLPPLTVQPIVENAVKHGVMKKDGGGTVGVAVSRDEDTICITVYDDGAGFDVNCQPTDGRRHIGIENVRRRLDSQCGGTLEIKSAPGEGTTAVITIPYIAKRGLR